MGKPTNPEMTLGQLKSLVVSQLLQKSPEFVEAWKQDHRNKKAHVYMTRQEVLSQITQKDAHHALTPTKNSAFDFTNKSTEEVKSAVMSEIKAKYNPQQITEEWREKFIAGKVATLNSRHQVLTQIAEKKSTKRARQGLESTTSKNGPCKNDLLADIRKRSNDQTREVLPAWKEAQMNQTRTALENKYLLLTQLAQLEKKTNQQLTCKDDLVTKRAKLMEEIRSKDQEKAPVVEAWKQANRNGLSNTMVLKQQVMADLTTKNQKSLKSIKDPRDLLLESIATAEDAIVTIEAWKIAQIKAKANTLKNRNAVLCDIHEHKLGMKPQVADRCKLLDQIRLAGNQQAPVEAWKQLERDEKANLIINKKKLMVDVEAPRAKALRKIESTPCDQKNLHMQMLSQIRSEAIPQWKEAINQTRVAAIQGKKMVNEEISVFEKKSGLKSAKNMPEQKVEVMKEIRAKFGNAQEAWKESQNNDRSKAVAGKSIVNDEIKNGTCQKNLKATKSQPELKCETLKELRLQADMALPAWKEEVLDEQAVIRGQKNEVVCQVRDRSIKSTLNRTASINEAKANVLKDLRRANPVESWKEETRTTLSNYYTARREVNLDISENKFALECARSQEEMRGDLLREIRMRCAESVVPAWKEARLSKRAEVFANKRALNRAIENLGL